MKALNKISYSEDVDILMIQLSDKKIDDAYEVGNMIIQVAENGEPVLLEIFNGSQFIKELNKSLPPKAKKAIYSQSTIVAHTIK